MNAPIKGLLEILSMLPERQDKRLERFEQIQALLEAFRPEPEEIDELLPSLFTSEMLADDELYHYVKYLRSAVHRWAQKQLMGWPAEDDCDAYELKRARQE